MANTIKLKRSAVAGKQPTTSDLQLGELGLNTYDGKLYTKKSVGGVESIVEIGAGGGGGGSGPLLQYDASLAENITLTTGYDGLAVDDLAVEDGYTLEVPSGQTFTIGSFDLAATGVAAGTYKSVTVDAFGRVTAGTNPTTFAGYSISDTSANLAAAITDETGSGSLVFATSPALAGTPTTPTAATSTNNTQIASTAFVRDAISTYAGTGLAFNSLRSNLSAPSSALANNSTGNQMIALGEASLAANTTGANNIGIGYYALTANSSGSNNVGLGAAAMLSNTTGFSNVAIGSSALYTSTIGARNVCIGDRAGFYIQGITNNTTAGRNNVAVGYYSLYNTTTGDRNIGIGEEALYANTTGYWNTVIGSRAGISVTDGFMNTAVGFESLFYSTGADYNAALGFRALHNATSNSNTGIGAEAGFYITTGGNNTCIGLQAGADAVANLTTQSNYVVLGNNSTANANIKVAWTVTSDARDKCRIAPCPHGLAFVTSLAPVRYEYRKSRDSDEPVTDGRPRYGFLAQDVLALEGEEPVIIDDRDPDSLKFTEASLIPVLVNAIQELSEQVSALTTRVAALEAN